MKNLITVRQNDTTIATCNANCYNSIHPSCACLCGGLCHGIGRDAAQSRIKGNTNQLMQNILRLHPEATNVGIHFITTVELPTDDH